MVSLTPLNKVVEDLSREAADLEAQIKRAEARLAKLRPLITGLKEVASDVRRQVVLTVPTGTNDVADPMQAALPTGEESLTRHRRGNTSKLVLRVIYEAKAGLTNQQLWDAVREELTSPAKNKRKLLSNVLAGLVDSGRLEKTDDGIYKPANGMQA